MKRASYAWVGVVAVGLAAVVGCAVGADSDGSGGTDDLTEDSGEAGIDSGAKLPPMTVDSGNEDAGTDAGDAANDSGADAGISCTAPTNCLSAPSLGSISGDENADTKTASGTGSQWFTVQVTENDTSSVVGNDLEFKADLISPPGSNFDLYIYRAGSLSGVECNSISASSSSTTTTDSASMSWGEGLVANGSDDGANVTVEVRHISGPCEATAKWSLTVRGNTK